MVSHISEEDIIKRCFALLCEAISELMMLPQKCLGAVIVTLFPHLTFADYFTNPPNFAELSDGTQIATFDLSTTYIFGGKVQITWFVPSLPKITLSMVHWGSSNDTIITTFLS